MTSASNDFEKVVSKLMAKLLDDINKNKDCGHKPLIMTVSRRMPHILFWYKECIASPEVKTQIDRLETITEIALPFIDFKNSEIQYDVYLLDDMVNTGNTYGYIKDLIEFFSSKPVKRSYVLFPKNKAFSYEYLNSGQIEIGKIIEDDEYKTCCEFISSIITATLPIDVTYPLLYLKEHASDFSFDSYKLKFRDAKSKDIENYEIGVGYRADLNLKDGQAIRKGDSNISYTSLLPSEVSSSLNNDFAKIRAYTRLGEFVVVPYAPNILSDDQLQDRNLFKCEEYKKVWSKVLDSIDGKYFDKYNIFEEKAQDNEAIGNRSRRSMVSIANYLYSLSSFNRILNTKNDLKSSDFQIKESDLTLLVGFTLAEKIHPLIQDILAQGLVSPRTHQKIKANSTLIPEQYDEDYTISKYMCVDGEDLEKDLMRVLNNAKKSRRLFPAISIEELEYSVEGIMESFESLEKALFIKDPEKKAGLYKLIDRKIDECVVVSRYAYTYDDKDERYWRRYFRMTSMNMD